MSFFTTTSGKAYAALTVEELAVETARLQRQARRVLAALISMPAVAAVLPEATQRIALFQRQAG